MSHVFILGASDAEMDAIEGLLKANGYPFAHATLERRRVRAGNAYRADATRIELASDFEPVFVECAVSEIERTHVIDHHRPGDPGYDRGPADYWTGSSLGQVHAFLGIDPTDDARIVAAADHCPTAAYRGLCPGVDPEALRAWRLHSRASRRGIPVHVVAAAIEDGIAQLRRLDRVCVEGHEIANAVGVTIPELPEASAITGIPVMHTFKEFETQRQKVSLLGASPEAIRAWMAWASTFLVDVYGAPERGYAGAYAP